jgi:methylenetetrahydrofolate--tRNA-(uracil-5-)-methyltransferase
LKPTLQLKSDGRVFFAGQISGVEGYAESIATGLMAGRNAAFFAQGKTVEVMPRETALGSLCHYITQAEAKTFQPANITFDLLPALDDEAKKKFKHDKKARHGEVCRRAQVAFEEFINGRHAAREFCEVSG